MQAFRQHRGRLIPLPVDNVDTDQIIPKQFLKRIERTGYADALFYDQRFHQNGDPKQGFVLNDERYTGGSILVTGKNFGCGSSREHAAWALWDYGVRVVIAPSFADIFFNNATKNGLLPVVLAEHEVRCLLESSSADPEYSLEVDLESCQVKALVRGPRFCANFELDGFRRHCLLHGLDDIELTLQYDTDICTFEKRRLSFLHASAD